MMARKALYMSMFFPYNYLNQLRVTQPRQPKTAQLFHRVIAAADKRVAAQDTTESKPHALKRTIPADSLDSVLRTGWDIPTAGRKKR
jgi:hypothetical protein